MTILLAGDIGGTKTILSLVQAEFKEFNRLPELHLLYEETYPSQEFPDLLPIVQRFYKVAQGAIGVFSDPQSACFGIAGPVINRLSKLTNLGWILEEGRLQQELGIPRVSLINDFAAVGYGVLGLPPEDLYPLRPGTPDPEGAIAIIGAGTGLGEGYVIPYAGGYRVFATEGGHADFAPRSELEYQLLRFLKENYNLERVSTERVVSGTGIGSIYTFMRSRGLVDETPEMTELYQLWQQQRGREQKTVDLPAVISQRAVQESDSLCLETMNLFIRAYGAEAGNLALKLLPYGGLYIAGGIAAKNLELMKRGDFLEAMDNKGRVRSAIAQIPVYVVTNPRVGLLGAAMNAALLAKEQSQRA